MALFNRQKSQQPMAKLGPEGAASMWTVWALSIATFVVTVVVVLGLFWGGRWVYRNATKKTPTATVTVSKKSSSSSSNSQNEANNKSSGSNGSSNSSTSGSSNSSPGSTTPPTASTTPSSSSSSNLINTGPTGPPDQQ